MAGHAMKLKNMLLIVALGAAAYTLGWLVAAVIWAVDPAPRVPDPLPWRPGYDDPLIGAVEQEARK